MHDSSVERHSPLACQLLTLGGLFRGAELGRALWREVLRASCGRPEPSDAALAAAFRRASAPQRTAEAEDWFDSPVPRRWQTASGLYEYAW